MAGRTTSKTEGGKLEKKLVNKRNGLEGLTASGLQLNNYSEGKKLDTLFGWKLVQKFFCPFFGILRKIIHIEILTQHGKVVVAVLPEGILLERIGIPNRVI